MDKLISEYRASGNISYIENLINAALGEKRREGTCDKFCSLVLVPEFGADVAQEFYDRIMAMDTAIISVNL